MSRLQPDPLALLVLSRSGAGKTSLQDAVCKFIPPESVIQYTRMTGQSLFYREQNALKNKVLAIEEEDGMREAMYSIKTLISSQKLSIAATRTDAKTGKFSVDEYTVYGPVVVMVSTTNPDALDDETKQRFLILTIDESPEQTRSILQAQITQEHDRLVPGHRRRVFGLQAAPQHATAFKAAYRDIFAGSSTRVAVRPPADAAGTAEVRITCQSHYASAPVPAQDRHHETARRFENGVCAGNAERHRSCLELGREVFARNVDDVSPTGRKLLAEIVGLVKEKYDDLQGNRP